jgi:hypothetical protein
MPTVWSVLADSRDDAARELRTLCDRLGLVVSGPPQEMLRDGKWLGRARAPIPSADADPQE